MNKEAEVGQYKQVLGQDRSKAWKLNGHDILGAHSQTSQPEWESYAGTERK